MNPPLPDMMNPPGYLNIMDPLDVASQSAAKALAAAESARAAPKATPDMATPTPETNVMSETLISGSAATPLHINNLLIMTITLVLLLRLFKT